MSSSPAAATEAKATPPSAGGAAAFVRALGAADRAVQRVEVALIVLAFALMIALAFAQVFLRTFQGDVFQPVGWFDNVARHLVIWVGVLGASLATAEGRHISIEVVPKLLGPRGRRRVDVLVNVAAAGVSAMLCALAVIYMRRIQLPNPSHLFQVEALGLNVYRWPFLVVVPIGLATIAWRFLLRAGEAVVLEDEEYFARERAFERELADGARPQEDDQVALLLQHEALAAEESGGKATLDPNAARAAVRAALHSDRLPAGAPAAGAEPSPTAKPAGTRPGRSTDEIPVYRELADDADLMEPERTRGAAGSDADELLDSDLADVVGGDEGAGAPTERMGGTPPPPAPPGGAEPSAEAGRA